MVLKPFFRAHTVFGLKQRNAARQSVRTVQKTARTNNGTTIPVLFGVVIAEQWRSDSVFWRPMIRAVRSAVGV